MVRDGKTIPISHIGSTTITTPTIAFNLNNVLCTPHIAQNLISIFKFCSHNKTSIEFFPDFFIVKDLYTGASLVCGRNEGNLYVWPFSPLSNNIKPAVYLNITNSNPTASLSKWHYRLGHPSTQVLHKTLSSQDISISQYASKFFHCDACLCNKSHKLPFGVSIFVCKKPLEILFVDVWGPTHIFSFNNYHYYVIFVDYFTKYIWLYLLKHKSEFPQVFTRFKTLAENFFNTKIKTVYSDYSGEASSLGHILTHHGIQHLKSPPHTAEHVGIAERKH